MISSALREGSALERADDRHQGRVHDRQAHNGSRHQQHEEDVRGHLVRAQQRDAAQREPEIHAARVAHEDSGGVEIEDEKSERGAADGEAQHRCLDVVHRDAEGEQEGRRDDGGASRQAIHVVEEIERVGDPNHPQDGQRNRDSRQPRRADLYASEEQSARGDNLRDQLGMRAQMPEIVNQTDDEQQRSTDDQTNQA